MKTIKMDTKKRNFSGIPTSILLNNGGIETVYTDKAREELSLFLQQQQKYLETYIVNQKKVLGDDVIEINVEDIKNYASNLKHPILRENYNLWSTILPKLLVLVLGALCAFSLITIFYKMPQSEETTGLFLSVMSLSLSLVTVIISYSLARRSKEETVFDHLKDVQREQLEYFMEMQRMTAMIMEKEKDFEKIKKYAAETSSRFSHNKRHIDNHDKPNHDTPFSPVNS